MQNKLSNFTNSNNSSFIFFIIFLTLFILKTIFSLNYVLKNGNNYPATLDDEFLYINNARNISQKISLIPEAGVYNLPILYPIQLLPTYVERNPLRAYKNVQASNILVSNALFFIAFILIASKIKPWLDDKKYLFFFSSYLITSSLPTISGFYLQAMSENLFIPIIFLIFSLFYFWGTKNFLHKNFYIKTFIVFSLSFLAGITRQVGLSAAISSFITIFTLFVVKFGETKKFKKSDIFKLISLILLTIIAFYFAYNFNSLIYKNDPNYQPLNQAVSKTYASRMLKRVIDIFTFKARYSSLFFVMKNELTYILIGTFFLPFLVFIDRLKNNFKKKSFDMASIFLLSIVIISYFATVMHVYSGIDNNTTHFITYGRYLDPIMAPLIFYGLWLLYKYLDNSKQVVNDKFLILFLTATFILYILFIKAGVIFGTNSFSISWLSVIKTQIFTDLIVIILLLLIYFILKNKKSEYYFSYLAIILIMLVGSFAFNSQKIKVNASLYDNQIKVLDKVVNQETNSKYQYYVNKSNFEKNSLLKVLYYQQAWYLAYYNNNFDIIPDIDIKTNLDKQKTVVLDDVQGLVYTKQYDQIRPMTNTIGIGIIDQRLKTGSVSAIIQTN